MNLPDSSDEEQDWGSKISSEEDEACMLVLNKALVPKLTNRKANKCEAKWISEGKFVGMAEVTKFKGKYMKSMGINRDGRVLLNIEEIGFLLQREALIVLNEGATMTIMDIYSRIMMGTHGCSWEAFKVYLELKNLGYIVGRHGVLWSHSCKKSDIVEGPSELMHNNLPGHFDILNIRDARFSLANHGPDTCSSALLDSHESPPQASMPENNTTHHGSNLLGSYNTSTRACSLQFDVFHPNCNFKKTDAGTPDFSLCTSSHAVPHMDALQLLNSQNNGVPVKIALVDAGRVTFFQFDEVQLPHLP